MPLQYWDIRRPLLFTPEDIDEINEQAILDFLAHPARVPHSATTIRDPTTQEDIQDKFNSVGAHSDAKTLDGTGTFETKIGGVQCKYHGKGALCEGEGDEISYQG
jgi:hypothetical protein